MGQFIYKTAGESHGKGLLAIIDGMVAGLELSKDYIANDLRSCRRIYTIGRRKSNLAANSSHRYS